jgi:cytosine/uracil/thiamine/allantoin permease
VAVFAVAALIILLYRIFRKRRPAQVCVKISKTGLSIILSWIFFTCAVLLLFARGVHDHYIIILWPVPMIILTYAVFWMKAKFPAESPKGHSDGSASGGNVFASLLALIIITSLLQIYSFYQLGHTPWSEFMPTYREKYQNSADVSEIGS